MFGRKQRTIYALRCRVADLEGRLCPGGAHDWVGTGIWKYFYDGISVDTMQWYECKRCGKIKLDWI